MVTRVIRYYRRILSLLDVKQKRRFHLIALLTLVSSLIDVLGLAYILPVLYLANDPSEIHSTPVISDIYDSLSFSGYNEFLVFLAVTLFLVFLVKNAFSFMVYRLQVRFSFNVALSLTEKQFFHVFGKDLEYFQNNNSQFIARDIATIPLEFSNFILQPLLSILTELSIAFFIAVGIALYDPAVFGLLLIIILPVALILYRTVRTKISALGERRNRERPMAFKEMFNAIHGFIDVELSNTKEEFWNKTKRSLRPLFDVQARLREWEYVPVRVIEMSAILGIVVLFVYSLYIDTNQSSTLISVIAIFATASYRLLPSINKIMGAIVRIKSSTYVLSILRERASRKTRELHVDPDQLKGDIEFSGVSYQYPNSDSDILRNVSLRIEPGQKVGIVGKSGAGKSTILKLILGLLYPTEGEILIDGMTSDTIPRKVRNDMIAYVQQDFFMIDATLAENIAFGIPSHNIDKELLNESIRKAELKELVDELPKGIHTHVGEFGSFLSGGQKQRIALARALYKGFKVLVLDEATSALDPVTEKEIIKTVDDLKIDNKTVITVTHRLSTVLDHDTIFLVENGVIRKITPDQLKEMITAS